jgi:hypothetical protein
MVCLVGGSLLPAGTTSDVGGEEGLILERESDGEEIGDCDTTQDEEGEGLRGAHT